MPGAAEGRGDRGAPVLVVPGMPDRATVSPPVNDSDRGHEYELETIG